jgi:Domain of unknown function (DUF5671)
VSNEEAGTSPWDVFINLLAVIALYASTWAVLALLFAYINLALPDTVDKRIDIRDSIRSALAVLIIFFPAYLWSWRAIEIDLAANPGKQRRWLRTCPIYLTLFLAGLLALGDLSCAVYYFLTGDLTLRFALKVIAIGLVAGSVFAFYLDALRRDPGRGWRGPRMVAYAASAAMAIVLGVGFATAGSPRQARRERLDAKRIERLDQIQLNIVDYWKRNRVLPATLDKLDDVLAGFSVPRDPESRRSFDYRATSSTSFELCADFATGSHDPAHTATAWDAGVGSDEAWKHDAGHVCFARTIDPSRYPARSGPSSDQ